MFLSQKRSDRNTHKQLQWLIIHAGMLTAYRRYVVPDTQRLSTINRWGNPNRRNRNGCTQEDACSSCLGLSNILTTVINSQILPHVRSFQRRTKRVMIAKYGNRCKDLLFENIESWRKMGRKKSWSLRRTPTPSRKGGPLPCQAEKPNTAIFAFHG